jgi:large subunit ribosomal protein L10
MNRQEKQTSIEAVRHSFATSSATFVIEVKGLTVSQLQALRQGLRAQQARLLVVKNTLGRRALSDFAKAPSDKSDATGLAALEGHLRNQVALIFAQEDPANVARELCSYAQKYERMQIVAGSLGSRVITESMVRFLGTLPPREMVVAQVCGALKAPIARHVGLLRQIMVRFLIVLQAIQQREEV